MKSMNFAFVGTFALAIALSACSPFNDNPKDVAFDTSSPTTWSTIEAEIAAAVPQDPADIKQGEYAHYTETYVFEDQVSELVGETTQTVTNLYTEPNDIMLEIAKSTVTYSNGQPTTVTTEQPACVALNDAGCGGTPTPTPAPTPSPTPDPSATPDPNAPVATPTPLPIEYYNFVKQVSVQAPPAPVQATTNCGGIENCQMHVITLSWDQIDRNTNPAGDRTHVVQQLSPDVPYLAGILSQCVTGLIPIQGGTTVLAQQCDNAVDFHFGHN